MNETETKDGRRARRSANRERIARAFLELVRSGESEPGTRVIAERAGVSPRTVFRCFEDMEALYRELTAAVRAEFLPRAVLDLNTTDRGERLDRLLANRTDMFGDMEPFRFASEAYRHRYASLEDDHDFLVRMERERLRVVLNPDGAIDDDTFEALTAVTSFEFWRRLRVDQGLSKIAAARVMSMTARAVFAIPGRLLPVADEGGIR